MIGQHITTISRVKFVFYLCQCEYISSSFIHLTNKINSQSFRVCLSIWQLSLFSREEANAQLDILWKKKCEPKIKKKKEIDQYEISCDDNKRVKTEKKAKINDERVNRKQIATTQTHTKRHSKYSGYCCSFEQCSFACAEFGERKRCVSQRSNILKFLTEQFFF